MSAVTLAFPCDHSAAGVLLLGPEVPIHEQIEKVQRWAATETTPLPGTARLEIWTSQGVRTRVSLPVSAPLAEDAPPAPDADLAAELKRLAEDKCALSAAVENLTRQLNGFVPSDPEPPGPDEAGGGDAIPAAKKKK